MAQTRAAHYEPRVEALDTSPAAASDQADRNVLGHATRRAMLRAMSTSDVVFYWNGT